MMKLVNSTKIWKNEKGELHREDGPAVIRPNGEVEYFYEGLRHREDGPAVITKHEICYYRHGLLHREDGPAIEGGLCGKEWFIDGIHHNDNGPIIQWDNGISFWKIKGQIYHGLHPYVILHRILKWIKSKLKVKSKT